METTVEIGGWGHECCGPSFERNEVIELRCFVVPEGSDRAARFVETHHDLDTTRDQVTVRGRVVDISIRHADGWSSQWNGFLVERRRVVSMSTTTATWRGRGLATGDG